MGHIACMGEIGNAHERLFEKPEEKRFLGHVDISVRMLCIETYLKEMGCEGVGWIHVVQYIVQWWFLVSMLIKFRFRKRWVIS